MFVHILPTSHIDYLQEMARVIQEELDVIKLESIRLVVNDFNNLVLVVLLEV